MHIRFALAWIGSSKSKVYHHFLRFRTHCLSVNDNNRSVKHIISYWIVFVYVSSMDVNFGTWNEPSISVRWENCNNDNITVGVLFVLHIFFFGFIFWFCIYNFFSRSLELIFIAFFLLLPVCVVVCGCMFEVPQHILVYSNMRLLFFAL